LKTKDFPTGVCINKITRLSLARQPAHFSTDSLNILLGCDHDFKLSPIVNIWKLINDVDFTVSVKKQFFC